MCKKYSIGEPRKESVNVTLESKITDSQDLGKSIVVIYSYWMVRSKNDILSFDTKNSRT